MRGGLDALHNELQLELLKVAFAISSLVLPAFKSNGPHQVFY